MHQLIPDLPVLDRLLIESLPRDRVAAVQRQTELLPFYIRGACFHLEAFEAHRHRAISALDGLPGVSAHTRLVLPPEVADPLSFAFDGLLFCLRRSFDSLLPYLSRCPRTLSLPSSMSDLAKDIDNGSYQSLDARVKRDISEFWRETGQTVKGYRDQASHKAVVLSNAVAFRANGRAGLRLLLPDDAMEKRPSMIGYRPGVPAMHYAVGAVAATVRLINSLVTIMIDLTSTDPGAARGSATVSIAMRGGPMQIAAEIQGELVPYPVDIQEVLANAIRAGRSA